MSAAAASPALRPAPRWGGGAPSHRRLVEEHLASLPHGLPRLRHVQELHAQLLKQGLHRDPRAASKLIASYALLRRVPACRRVFSAAAAAAALPSGPYAGSSSTLLANTLLRAYALNALPHAALAAFAAVPSRQRDTFTYSFLIKALATAGVATVRAAHSHVVKLGSVEDTFVGNALIDAYSKTGVPTDARKVFDEMPARDVVLFTQMKEAAVELDVAAVVSILAACAESGSLALGKRIHRHVRQRKLGRSTLVCNALMDMFCKCGCVNRADYIFDTEIVEKDSVSWNTIIGGFAMHGDGEKALDLFAQMKEQGFRPDAVTLINVLSACTHMGFMEEGRRYFANMETDYGIRPQIEHYGCMVDLLGRGGLIKEAVDMIKSMPWEPNEVIWGSLLGACRLHKNVEYAELAVNELSKLQPSNAGNYAVLSNIYAEAGQWSDMAKARMQMKGTGSLKTTGSSWIELDEAFHEFTVGDRKHPESDQISEMVGRLSSHVKHAGCVPEGHELLVQ
ncbi:hypothetical protein HU200_052695 [Digitaria exilis]|uniref:Pentatricopeptide repeat-containing protein n=1 Tax=Digitaria exilis TaxID=1010633 RepID=A0A835AY39_9POAL|nr:hypothetical protein HU200_052695 [Digitaria exilis]